MAKRKAKVASVVSTRTSHTGAVDHGELFVPSASQRCLSNENHRSSMAPVKCECWQGKTSLTKTQGSLLPNLTDRCNHNEALKGGGTHVWATEPDNRRHRLQ
eukprot:3962589-Amphidinium_carterae.1